MTTFISAVQKLVIKDVALYTDRKTSTTKLLVGKNNLFLDRRNSDERTTKIHGNRDVR